MQQNIPDFVSIDGSTTLLRDTASMGIVSTDTGSQLRYRKTKKRFLEEKRELSTIKDELLQLRRDMVELKNLIVRCGICRPASA